MNREEALRRVKGYLTDCLPSEDYDEVEEIMVALNQQKEGHWKRIGYDIYECSICGQNVQTGDICAYKHCHGCGAHMKGGE